MNTRKNMIWLLIMAVCIICLGGCAKKEQEGTPVEISYLNKSETKIVTEQHYLEGTTTKEMIVEVLTLLCSVPENKELKATLSGGINIINYSLDGGQVTVSLGEKYKELSRTTEVLTRAAVVRSLTQIPDVEYVMITVAGEPLMDMAGNPLGIMTADMFVDNEGEQMNSYEKVTIRLYFANETGDGLIPINRELLHNIDVSNIESYPTIKPDTKLLGVTVKDGICYVNLDSAFLTPVNQVTSDVTIYSITNSLVELSNINKVQISIDGKKDVKFRDKYNLTTIFERNLQLLQ